MSPKKSAEKTTARKNEVPASSPIQGDWVEMVSTGGRKFKVPVEFSEMLADLVRRVNCLAAMLNGGLLGADIFNTVEDVQERQAAASMKRIEQSDSSSHGVARETFPTPTGNSDGAARETFSTPTGYCGDLRSKTKIYPSSLPSSAYQHGADKALWEGRFQPCPESSLDTCDEDSGNSSAQSSREDTRMEEVSLDARCIVDKWQVHFSGEGSQRVEEFLSRVEGHRTTASLSEEEMMDALPDLLTGSAAIWCEEEKHKWQSWTDFVAAAEDRFGTNLCAQRLLKSCYQKQGEPIGDFAERLIFIADRLWPVPDSEALLELLYERMLPSLLEQVKHAGHSSWIEMVLEAERIEARQVTCCSSVLEDSLPLKSVDEPAASVTRTSPAVERTNRFEQTTAGCGCQETDDTATSRRSHSSGLHGSASEDGSPRLERRKRRRRKRRKSPPTAQSPSDTSSSDESEKKVRTNRDRARRSRLKFDPTQPLRCYGCGRLGFMERYCPDCKDFRGT